MGIDKIKHFVVLMLENRSFDHMLGFLKSPSYPIDGLTGAEVNPVDPHVKPPELVRVSKDAAYYGDINNPSHSMVPGALAQLFGMSYDEIMKIDTYPHTQPANNGFVYDYAMQNDPPPPPTIGPNIMKCLSPGALPALAGLAKQFAICDHWFSSVPGPTWPNRWFAHAASSDGYCGGSARTSTIKTIYNLLSAAGLSWMVYFHDVPQTLSLLALWDDKPNFQFIDKFLEDAQSGHLPAYSFIKPRYFDIDSPGHRANDQHPPHDVRFGEELIATVYNAVRSSPQWNETALVILYDEHGGMFDHAAPGVTVSPDGKTGSDDLNGHFISFLFNCLGARVPAVVVSPYIAAGTICSTVFDHSSIPATIEKRFRLPHLSARDAQAKTFDVLFTLNTPRTDTPSKILPPAIPKPEPPMQAELSDAQFALLDLADSFPGSHPKLLREKAMNSRRSEPEAGAYAAAATQRFLGQ